MSDALKMLYERHGPMVYRRCRSILKNDDEALDGVQAVFLKIAERTGLVGRLESPTTYLYRVATHYALDRLARERRSLDWPDEEPAAPGTDHEALTEGRLQLARLFGQVPAKTREVAYLRWVDGMTWEETAKAAGMSVSGVRKTLARLTRLAQRQKEKTL